MLVLLLSMRIALAAKRHDDALWSTCICLPHPEALGAWPVCAADLKARCHRQQLVEDE